jgi:hypothetical protein
MSLTSPQCECGGGVDLATREDQLFGAGGSDEPGESVGAAPTGDRAESGFGEPEAGVELGDAQVAGEGELETSSDSEPVDDRDGGLRQVCESVEDAVSDADPRTPLESDDACDAVVCALIAPARDLDLTIGPPADDLAQPDARAGSTSAANQVPG